MTLKLSAEDEVRIQQLVEAGRFSDIEDVIHAGLDALEDEERWKGYVRERIDAGLSDVAAGRTVPGDVFLESLQNARLKRA